MKKRMFSYTVFLCFTLLMLTTLAQCRSVEAAFEPKVVLYVLNGVRQDLLNGFIEEGVLPNFERLRSLGVTANVSESIFPQGTAAVCGSLATGMYPRSHGITGDRLHVKGTPLSAYKPGVSSSNLLAEPIWKTVKDAGLNVTIVNFPLTSPPQVNETIVDGFNASIREPALYTTIESIEDCTPINVTKANLALWRNLPRFNPDLEPREVEVAMGPQNATLYFLIVDSDVDGLYETVYVCPNRDAANSVDMLMKGGRLWTRPVQATIDNVPCAFRLRLVNLTDDAGVFSMYRTWVSRSVNFTQPGELSERLFQAAGPFIAGPDYEGLSKGWFDEAVYMENLEMVAAWYVNAVEYCIKNTGWRLFALSNPIVDEVQRRFLGFITPGHPCYDPARRDTYLGYVKRAYIYADTLVGKTLENIDEDTVFMVVSCYATVPTSKTFFVNNLFQANGWLNLTEAGQINWVNTKVYFFGDGQVFLNLEGREPEGVVEPSDYDTLKTAVVNALTSVTDGGRKVFTLVVTNNAGAPLFQLNGDRIGDILVIATSDYLLSGETMAWEAALFQENPQYLTGQPGCPPLHEGSQGLFMAKGPFIKTGAITPVRVVDLTPTMAAILGVRPSSPYEGSVVYSMLTVKVGGVPVVEGGVVDLGNLQGVEEKIMELEGVNLKLRTESLVYAFVTGLTGLILGVVLGLVVKRKA